jgi:hypothetical protein
MKKQQPTQRPFFAKFLEAQQVRHNSIRERGKDPIFTLKLIDDLEQTQKAPSDKDEI